jgi:hypothetical protein
VVGQFGNNEVMGMLREVVMIKLEGCPGICLGGLRKYMKNLRQDSWCLDQDINLEPPGYEAGVLTTIIAFSNFSLN